jgi:hypothetical protein
MWFFIRVEPAAQLRSAELPASRFTGDDKVQKVKKKNIADEKLHSR